MPESFGATYIDRIGVALTLQDVGDAIDDGFEAGGVAGAGSGEDNFQAVFGAAAEPDEAFLSGRRGGVGGAVWVGLEDGGLQQGVQPGPRKRTKSRCDVFVNHSGLLGGEVSSGGGDAAGLVGRHLPSVGSRPDQPEPVS